MKKFFSLILLILITNSIHAQVFAGESVEYDSTGHRFFTSSDATSIIQRASNGTLSYFGSGLTAHYGMEIMGNTLFAISGTSVKGYDLTTALQVMSATVAGANFLNGLTNDGNGILYATDYGSKKIYKIDATNMAAPIVTTIVTNTVSTPNGIVYDGANNRLIFVNWGSNAPIKAVDLTTNTVSMITTTTLGSCDGIDDDGYGHYYVSSWNPARITRFDSTFTGTPVTITASGISSPADIVYAKSIDTLAIPMSASVKFIGFALSGIGESKKYSSNIILFPNPVTESSYFKFELKKVEHIMLSIFDETGKEVAALINEKMTAGEHYVLLTGIELRNGNYIYRFSTHDKTVSGKFVKM